jgi:hypothetical protein
MLLEVFPFVIQGFHADNGSEYINKRVAQLLNKLLTEFTKSRARQLLFKHIHEQEYDRPDKRGSRCLILAGFWGAIFGLDPCLWTR